MSKVFDNGILRDMTAKEQEQHDALQKNGQMVLKIENYFV